MNSAIILLACLAALTSGQAVQQQPIQVAGAQVLVAPAQPTVAAVAQPVAVPQPTAAIQTVAAAQPAAAAQLAATAQPTAVAVLQTTAQTNPNGPAGRSYGPVYTGFVPGPAPVYDQTQVQVVQQLSAVDASRQLIAAAIAQGANPNNFGVQTNARYNIAQAPNPQVPVVWHALDALRGRAALTIDEILNILSVAVAGRDYPYYNDIPSTRFSCESVRQAGFYADPEAQCQVIRRCDINGVMWSYLCPNMTMFNQITLVCDWFFNVNCQYSTQYYDYSNPRLYTQFALLDTPAQTYVRQPYVAQAAAPIYRAPAAAYGTVVNGPVYQG